jgi:two-component system sensor histidine kinase KdpD
MRPVGLDEVVAGALASLSRPTGRVRVDIDGALPAAVADGALLERVVANVISNALQHAPGDSPVLVDAANVAGSAVLRVVDHGPGVEPEAQERMFDPFQRMHDHGAGGVGLGLAVASGFMRAMHGSIEASDTPGGGMTVTLRLPLADDVAEAPNPVEVRG